MFPSATVNGVLHAYAEQYLFDHASLCSRNDILSPFFHFSPTINDGDVADAFLPHQQDLLDGQQFPHHPLMANASPPATAEATSNTTAEAKLLSEDICSLMGPSQSFFPRKSISSLGRKRGSKKDRHSKIVTRQGPRDRRMRLSLEIARQFFDLQDMLGFDKASKTVDWLMTKAREAIKQLARDLSRSRDRSSCGRGGTGTVKCAVSSASEGEVVSGMDESASNPGDREKAKQIPLKAKRSRLSRKASFNPLSKEYRAIARARARERTKTKKMMNISVDEPKPDQLPNPKSYDRQNQATSNLRPHKIGEEPVSQSSDKVSPELVAAEVEEPPSLCQDHQSSLHDTVEDSLSIFHYGQQMNITIGSNSDDLISLQNNDMINFLQENWHMDSTRPNSAAYCAIPNAHLSTGDRQEQIDCSLFKMLSGNRLQPQFNEMQFCAKPWEDYDS